MARQAVVLGGESFRTKGLAVDRLRGILWSVPVGTEVKLPADVAVLRDAIGRHHQSARKIGCGVAAFGVQEGLFRTRCFWLRRDDGTRTDFSMLECFREPSAKRDALAALRSEIEPQISEFRSKCGGVTRCEMTGDPLEAGPNSHVDHIPPLTFERLAADFVASKGLEWADLAVKPHGDGDMAEELADVRLRVSWWLYHEKHARLRLVSARGNLTQKRKEVA